MAKIIELYDGTRLEFPDETELSVIQATAKRITAEKQNEANRNKTLTQDLISSAKQTAARLPSKLTGLLDIPVEAVTGKNLVSEGWEQIGELTGFQPSKYADTLAQRMSNESMAGGADIDEAEKTGSMWEIAKAYGRNPRKAAELVAGLIPDIAGAGVVGGAIGSAAKIGSGLARGVIGEGALETGGANAALDEAGFEGRKAALASLGAGVTTGLLGAGAGRIAKKLGGANVDEILTGGTRELTEAQIQAFSKAANQGIARRVGVSAATEGLLEELPQSVQSQMFQNWASNKDLFEGVPRAAVEGTIGGALVGGAFGAVAKSPQAQAKEIVAQREEAERARVAEEQAALTQEEEDDGIPEPTVREEAPAPELTPLPELVKTKEGIKQVIRDIKLYHPDYTKQEINIARGEYQRLLKDAPKREVYERQKRQAELEAVFPPDVFGVYPERLAELGITNKRVLKELEDLTSLGDTPAVQKAIEALNRLGERSTSAAVGNDATKAIDFLEQGRQLVDSQGQIEMFPNERVEQEPSVLDDEEVDYGRQPKQLSMFDTKGRVTRAGAADSRLPPNVVGYTEQPTAPTPQAPPAVTEQPTAQPPLQVSETPEQQPTPVTQPRGSKPPKIKESPKEAWGNMVDEVPFDALPQELKDTWADPANQRTGEFADEIVREYKRMKRIAEVEAKRAPIPTEEEVDRQAEVEDTKPSKLTPAQIKTLIDKTKKDFERVDKEMATRQKKYEQEAKKRAKQEKLLAEKNEAARKEREQKQAEREAAQEQKREAERNTNKLNFVDGVSVGANVPSGFQEIVAEWKQMLNIPSNILLVTDKDIAPLLASGALDGTPHRNIAFLPNSTEGRVTHHPDGSRTIALQTRLFDKPRQALTVLAHEMGHIHEKESFVLANNTTQVAVRDAFHRFLKANGMTTDMFGAQIQRNMPMREFLKNLRSVEVADMVDAGVSADMTTMDAKRTNYRDFQYFTSFAEWYADQVSKWAVSNKKPQGIVEKFMNTVGKALRKFYQSAKNKQYLADPTFEAYMNKVTEAGAANRAANAIEVTEGDTSENLNMAVTNQADTLLKQMGGMFVQNTRTTPPTFTQAATNVAKSVASNPMGITNWLDSWIQKVRVKAVDRYASVGDAIREANNGAFRDAAELIRPDILASQNEQNANITDAVLTYGGIQITKGGLLQAKTETASIDGVFRAAKRLANQIGEEKAQDLITKTFYAWRANSLLQRPRDEWPENWITDPKAIPTPAQINAAMTAMQQIPELAEIKAQFIGAKNNAVRFLNESGFLSAKKTQEFLADDSYAPWYRLKEYEDKLKGLGNTGRIVDLAQMKKLKGGTDEVNDMLENMTQVVSWMVRSGSSNYTANRSLTALEGLGRAKSHKSMPRGVSPDSVVMTYVGGVATYWTVDNPLDLAAFMSVKGLDSTLLRATQKIMSAFRASIVLFPAFPISQIIQDSYRLYTYSGVKNPASAVKKAITAFVNGDAYKGTARDVEILKQYGVAGEVDFNTMDETRGRGEKFELGKRDQGIIAKWMRSPAYKKLHRFSYSSDLAVRLAIYRQTMEETGDQELAATRAREIINFQKSGSSGLILTAKRLIPFLGAYLQGTDVLYRSATGRGNSMTNRKAAMEAFWKNVGTLSALTIAYTMMMSGDDEYEEQKGYVTDRNFLIPGTDLKLPVPPDVGFLFKVIPERITDYVLSQATEEPESSGRLKSGLATALHNAIMPPSTVAVATPFIELQLNRSFFSELPIVGRQQEMLEPSEQYTASTSELAKEVGQITGMSPMKIDHVLKAIGGTSAGAALSIFDALASNKVAPDQTPVASTFTTKTVGGRFTEEFYELRELVDRADATVKLFEETGQEDKLEEYAAKPEIEARLGMVPYVAQIERQLAEYRKLRKAIENDPAMTPDEKREAVNELLAEADAYVREAGVMQLRKEAE